MARKLARSKTRLPLRPLAPWRARPGAVKMDTQRLILLFIFSFSLLMLWEAWDKQNRPKPAAPAPTAQSGVPAPATPPKEGAAKPAPAAVPGADAAAKGEIVR